MSHHCLLHWKIELVSLTSRLKFSLSFPTPPLSHSPISESRRVLQESCDFFLKHNSRVQHKKKHYKSNSHKLKVISKSMGTNTSAQTTVTTNHDLSMTTSNYYKGTPVSGSERRGSSKSSVLEQAASAKVSSQNSKERKSSKAGSSVGASGNGEPLQSLPEC